MLRDSLGIQLLDLGSSPFESGAAWRVGTEPILSIGLTSGPATHELHDVVMARRLVDGSIVIANAGTAELRVYGEAGDFVRSIGGPGEGPGEFRSLSWLQVLAPDTLMVVDADLRRVTAFDTMGQLQWTTAIPSGSVPVPGDARLDDGSIVFLWDGEDVWQRVLNGTTPPGRTDRNTASLVRYGPDGLLLDTLARFPGNEEAVILSEGRPATTFPPWGRITTYAVAGSRIFIGSQDDGEVVAYHGDGRLSIVIRWPTGDLSITSDALDRYSAPLLDRAGEDTLARSAIVSRMKSVPHPDRLPAYGRVILDSEALLWVSERHGPFSEPTRWTVIRPGTGVVGAVTMPNDFRLFEAGRDYVLGRGTDELGVESVELLRLDRGGA